MSDASDRDPDGPSDQPARLPERRGDGVGGTLASGLLPDAPLRAQAPTSARRGAVLPADAHRHARQPRRILGSGACHARRPILVVGRTPTDTRDDDLVVVGGGISGLVRGTFLPAARGAVGTDPVLINHDDFRRTLSAMSFISAAACR